MITTKMVNEWIELYKQGYSCLRIAKMYNLKSTSVIWRNLKSRGVKTSNRKTKIFDNPNYVICIYDKQDTLIYLFDSVKQMSEKLNINKMTIFYNLAHKRKYININHKRYKIMKVRLDKE